MSFKQLQNKANYGKNFLNNALVVLGEILGFLWVYRYGTLPLTQKSTRWGRGFVDRRYRRGDF